MLLYLPPPPNGPKRSLKPSTSGKKMNIEHLKQFAEDNPELNDPAHTDYSEFRRRAKAAEQWDRDWEEDDWDDE